VLHYLLINGVICHTWPDFADAAPGLIPAAFAVPALTPATICVAAFRGKMRASRVLAWFWRRGVALHHAHLPAQFHREWLTISWRSKAPALLWLFHRCRIGPASRGLRAALHRLRALASTPLF